MTCRDDDAMLKNKIDKLDLKGQNRRSSATSGPVRDRAGEVSGKSGFGQVVCGVAWC